MHRVEITKARDDGGIMVALMLPQEIAERIALPGYEPAGKLHVTLAYCGSVEDASQESIDLARDLLGSLAMFHGQLRARLVGYGRFEAQTSDDEDIVHAVVVCPGINMLRELATKCLEVAGLTVDQTFAFMPHVTLAYVEPGAVVPTPQLPIDVIDFNELAFVTANLTSHCALLGENTPVVPPAPEPVVEPVPEPEPVPILPPPPTVDEIVERVMLKILASGVLLPPKRGKVRRILVKNPVDGTLAEVIEEPID